MAGADERGMGLAQFALAIPPVEGEVVGREGAVEVRTTDGGVAEDMDDVTLPTKAPSLQRVTRTPADDH